MADNDALRNFEFPRGKGLFLTFSDGDEFKVRVLTTDPVVSENVYEDPKTGDETVTTKFAFIVWNFTLNRAQILNAGATITREIQRLHQDEEWGANIKKMDIKISAVGEKLSRRYTITPLPKAETLNADQVKECQAIDLDTKIDGQRMSFYKPKPEDDNGYKQAKAKAEELRQRRPDESEEDYQNSLGTALGNDEPINLDDIPF